MRFLLDENISPIIGGQLRAAGHDVLMASSVCRGEPDEVVVEHARSEQRILISEDKDFGELAFRDGIRPPGVIRVVLPMLDPEAKAERLLEVLKQEPQLLGGMLVVEPARTRFRAW